jgi:tRNA (cmo5U34)-methyltransferase
MKDEIIAGTEWSFDESVAVVFDDMLSRSIPGYEEMRSAVIRMIEPIAPNGGFVLDMGCSHGEMISMMQQKFSGSLHLSYVGIDYSSAMVTRARQRFSIDDTVSIVHADLKEVELARLRYDIVLSILTLQFVPIEYRQELLRQVYNSVTHNGCFILVEKVLGENHISQEHLVDVYLQMKKDNHYTDEQISTKRASLENVLVPLRTSENIRLLKEAGFTTVQPFWQNLNFVGIYASKEK